MGNIVKRNTLVKDVNAEAYMQVAQTNRAANTTIRCQFASESGTTFAHETVSPTAISEAWSDTVW